VRLATQVCLPSLLDDEVPVTLDIFTDQPQAFDCKTTLINGESDKKHKLVSNCHRQSIASREPTVIVQADMVFGKGTLKALLGRIEKNKRLILVPSPRTERVKMLPSIKAGMTNRELSALAIENLHPGFDLMFWEKQPFTDVPYQIYWKREHGLIVRCFHMHPLLVWLETKQKFTGTVDDDCVNLFTPTESCIIVDSDEIACFEMSPSSYSWQTPGERGAISSWVKRKTNAMHRWFFTHECHIHTGIKVSVPLPQELIEYG